MDELLLRQIPHSVEGEQAVLGSMLIDPECVKDVVDKLHASDFYLHQNRQIYETILSMFTYAKAIDGVTVCQEMQVNGTYDENTTKPYLVQLMEVTPTAANVMEYVKIVKDKAVLRSILEAVNDISSKVQEGVGEAQAILENAEQQIYAIRNGHNTRNMTPVSEVLPSVMERMGELAAAGGKVLPGLSSGFSDLDRKTNGFNKSDLLILAARPGMGKTSMALNMALNVAKQSKQSVAIFSLEMSKEQLVTRLLSTESLVELTRLNTGNLRESDWTKIADAASVLSKAKILIDDNPLLTISDMNARCRRIEDLGLIVIDYMQLMTGAGFGSSESRQQQVSDISRMMKIMAKELKVPVVCLSQLSRANEKRENKRPLLSDLRESGSIEQDADIVMFLFRDDYYNEQSEERNISECIIAKNRHGETGTVKMRWMPEFTMFSSLEHRYDEEDDL